LSLLARREHSWLELRHKLAARGYDDAEVDQVLAQLEQERLLSDERFAETYVRTRRERGFGPLRIRAELQERGVADELIARHLEAASDTWRELARDEHRRRFGDVRPADFKERARRARFLQGRGFPVEVVSAVLDEVD